MSQSGRIIVIISLCHRILAKWQKNIKNDFITNFFFFIKFWYNQSDLSFNLSTKFYQNLTHSNRNIIKAEHTQRQTHNHNTLLCTHNYWCWLGIPAHVATHKMRVNTLYVWGWFQYRRVSEFDNNSCCIGNLKVLGHKM